MNSEYQPAAASVPSVWLLGVASSLSPFGMAIVVPAMASIVVQFSAEFTQAQFVISAYLFGLAVTQPVSGYLCDRFGRRPVMLTGFIVFTLASLACALAESLAGLVTWRFLQAAGVSVGTVASRAILRDTRSSEKTAEAMSYIAAAMGIAPVIAPILGGLLDAGVGYRSIFIVSAVIGAIVFVGMFLHLSETLVSKTPVSETPVSKTPVSKTLDSSATARPDILAWIRNYGVLLKSPHFVGNTLIYGFVQGAFFCFLAVGAPYFESAYGMDSRAFGLVWGAMAVVYVIGATVGARLTAAIGTDRTMAFGIWINVAAGLLLLLVGSGSEPAAWALLTPLALLMALAGITTPGALAGAVSHHPTMAGTASGLSSAIGLVLGGSFTVVSGSLYAGNITPVVQLIGFACVAAAASWRLARVGLPVRSAS